MDGNFVAFLKATLSKMVSAGVLKKAYISMDFWAAWPRRFYHIRKYDQADHLKEDDPAHDDLNPHEEDEEDFQYDDDIYDDLNEQEDSLEGKKIKIIKKNFYKK